MAAPALAAYFYRRHRCNRNRTAPQPEILSLTSAPEPLVFHITDTQDPISYSRIPSIASPNPQWSPIHAACRDGQPDMEFYRDAPKGTPFASATFHTRHVDISIEIGDETLALDLKSDGILGRKWSIKIDRQEFWWKRDGEGKEGYRLVDGRGNVWAVCDGGRVQVLVDELGEGMVELIVVLMVERDRRS
ncbi:hypothetical protein HDV00_007192 [Rhizophlyctis rosea]|nr:hypothetical protein HDV00_007192 [Rhizophlyctis rosea]